MNEQEAQALKDDLAANDSVSKLINQLNAIKKRCDDQDKEVDGFAEEMDDLRTKIKDLNKKADDSKNQLTSRDAELESLIKQVET